MKKTRIKALFAAIFALTGIALFADEVKSSPFSMRLTTDLAYYPKNAPKTGSDTHFAPVTGVFDKIECRTNFIADYKINTPLGEHWLLSDANVILSGACELTPVSLRPQISLGFQPLPFFVIKGGSSVGLGWNAMGFEGICKFNEKTREYEKISPVNHPHYDVWGQAMLMFDTGAIVPGDWNHVVMLASYTISYSGIAGLGKGEAFEWQCSKNLVKGTIFEVQGILGYQMPLALSMAGVIYNGCGHFNGSDYGDYNENYDGKFVTHSVSPFFQFNLSDKDELFCLFNFSSRRGFETKPEKDEDELFMKKVGREWYFNRIALSWTHKF